jgi:hypothetical protein
MNDNERDASPGDVPPPERSHCTPENPSRRRSQALAVTEIATAVSAVLKDRWANRSDLVNAVRIKLRTEKVSHAEEAVKTIKSEKRVAFNTIKSANKCRVSTNQRLTGLKKIIVALNQQS